MNDKITCRTVSAEWVAAALGCHINTVYKLATSGDLPCIKIGRVYRFPKGAILKLLGDAGAEPPAAA